MNLSWDTRGLGNPRAFRELRRLVAEKKPTLLFLCETKMREVSCIWWKQKLGFSGCFMVDCKGRRGGLALLWDNSVDVSIKSYTQGHIDCIVHDPVQDWRFTGFYGNPEVPLRQSSWKLLHRLKDMEEFTELPWLVGGDFNEICFDSEKLGGNRRAPSQMQAFRDVLELCELQDLHSTGDFYTWVNRRDSHNIIFERLDRFVGNLKWRLHFPAARVNSLEFYHSDHRPLCLKLHGDRLQEHIRSETRDLRFRFEKGWLLADECREVIKQGWGTRYQHLPFFERIASCRGALINWDANSLRRIPKRLKSKRSQLNMIKTSAQWIDNMSQIKTLESEIEDLATQEETYWRQRSRISWLKDGDRNTRYFHSKASARRNHNSITGLVSSHGDWCSENRGISKIVLEYFETLFTSSKPTAAEIGQVLETIEPKVDDHMNQILCAPFIALESRRALFDMHPDKAPGPDGLSTLFYQNFWDIVGNDVTEAVLSVLNDGASLETWSDTLVTLIPKTKDPMLVKDYRPISLCNVCYKIVSRALTNRFRKVLSKLIEDSQSAFIPGRLITDNIIVGFEVLHWLRNRKSGRSGYAALKLDMSKAYDRVEWDFLHMMMLRMGFEQNWIAKVMNCVKSVSYYFRINQEVAGPIIPSRGLRQGDPLSPYLFVLCAHGLSSLFNTFESRGLFRGVKIAPTSPSVSHLFFADDSLVFFRATMEEGARVKDCLSLYEKASGQIINYDKSALSFSPNTHTLLMGTIKNIFTIPVVHQHDLYLGLPTVSLRSKRLQFKYLVDRVVQRIQGWGNKWFSTGGKEVLIKSILQAVPTFAMSCFKLPLLVCEAIERECANFWWGVENGRRKMHWQTWDALCLPKGRGGLGFRKLVEFNKAFLAKQLWRLIRNPESLAGRVLKGRYFRHGSVLNAGLGSNPSYIWRSLIGSKDLLEKGLLWRVGDGRSIKNFEERWIPSMNSILGPPLVPWDRADTVSSLIKEGNWDTELIYARFNPYVAGEIIKIPIPAANVCDCIFWRYDTKGKYTVRDGCRLQRGLFSTPEHQSKYPNEEWWSFIWSLSVPPKIRLFWWHITHDCIPSNQNLFRHHVPVTESCSLCNFPMDSTCHALFFCAAIKHLWKNTSFAFVLRGASQSCTLEFCLWLKTQLSKAEFEGFAIHAWAVWREKQNFLHSDKEKPITENVSWSSVILPEFQKARAKEKIEEASLRQNSEKVWKPPDSCALKLNVDVAVNEDRHQFGIGGAIRDNQGRLLLAFGKQINQPISVVHGELLAIREGVILLYDRGFSDVQVATDSQLAVQAVTTNQEDLGYIGFCVADIRERLKTPVISEIIHVRSSANKVAHNLARFSFSSLSPFVWVNGEFPSWLVRLVMDDF